MNNNDEKKIKEIFYKYYKNLVGFSYTIIKNYNDAEDIVIKVFYNYIRINNCFENDEKIKAYLFLSVKHASISYIKANKLHKEKLKLVSGSIPIVDELKDEGMPELMMHIFMEAEKLPRQCREVFFMSYKSGLNCREISKHLNVTISTVMTQKARAITFLKKKLQLK